ncbi:MarR family protein [Leptospira inadai serovar Lyme str. 10]|uniref:MarR family protein n=2 Tax=Leptospira inadai serovar Lyme TaxID=293084 RepID=V6H966_9LEPT|nr:MarR family transcriptional regulator [Leptospira inadai]EQA35427.1 MarR family protein [Leptospira inadai serovar Lyme str. 10]PNV73092.1 MarR family transcriptional regulator [Leptospira inadai serovar Lyme]
MARAKTDKLQELSERFRTFSRDLKKEFGQIISQEGYTMNEFIVLRNLFPNRLRSADLARELDVSPAYITVLIEKLRAKGLLDAIRNEGDRRAWDLELTSAGKKIFQKLDSKITDCVSERFQMLDAAEIESLNKMMIRLSERKDS